MSDDHEMLWDIPDYRIIAMQRAADIIALDYALKIAMDALDYYAKARYYDGGAYDVDADMANYTLDEIKGLMVNNITNKDVK